MKRDASSCPCLYVVNSSANSVTVYPVAASGNSAPTRTITGPKTKLYSPRDVAVDDSGRIYVSNTYFATPLVNRITVFSADANGNVSPIQSISGSKTQLHQPLGVAVDGSGKLYVANSEPASDSRDITVYAPGANGNVTPIATITSPTFAGGPSGLAWDKNLIYVSCSVEEVWPISVYKSSDDGHVAPVRIIGSYPGSTDRSGLYNTYNIAVGGRKIYAGNDTSRGMNVASVTEYPIRADGNVPPSRTIEGKKTKVGDPSGLAVDANSDLYVSHSTYITVYAPGKGEHPKPIRVLKGSKTRLDGAHGIAIH